MMIVSRFEKKSLPTKILSSFALIAQPHQNIANSLYFTLEESQVVSLWCTCCGSILSLVQILYSFVLGIVMYDNEIETKENKLWTRDKIEPQHTHQFTNIHFWNQSKE